MPNIGLIVALKTEIPDIFQGKPGIHKLGHNTIKVVVSGIGQRKARAATKRICTEAQSFQPDLLLVLGFCGGTRDDLKIGDLICANRLTNGNHEIDLDNLYYKDITQIFNDTGFKTGKLRTFNWPVLSRSGISEDTIAVDMESYAITAMARKYQIPSVVIKAVSDIVPEKSSTGSIANLLKTVKGNINVAKAPLNEFTCKYFL